MASLPQTGAVRLQASCSPPYLRIRARAARTTRNAPSTISPVRRHRNSLSPSAALKSPQGSHLPDSYESAACVPEASPASKTVKVVFRLPEHEEPGQTHKLVGSCPELGTWDLDAAPLLTAEGENEWSATVVVPCGSTCEFKAVLVDESAQLAKYEEGGNRSFTVPDGPSTVDLHCEWNHTHEYTISYTPDIQANSSSSTEVKDKHVVTAAIIEKLGLQYKEDLLELLLRQEAELTTEERELHEQQATVKDLQAQVAETRALMREVEAAMSEGSSLETLLNLVTHAFPGNRDEAVVTPNKQGDTVLASEVEEAQKWIAAWRGIEEAAVPANTSEAKAWIGAWRGKQGTSETTVDQVDEAQRWIKAWRSRQDVKDAIPASVLEARQWIAAWRGRMQGEQVDVLPANVSEAQQWVAAWRGKQQQQADVPVNVKEAQQWIAAWRVMQQRADVPANAREAQGWIAAWRGKQQQQQQQGDATTVDEVTGVQGWVASWRGRHTSNAATPNSVREAQQWIAAWRGRQGQEAATADEVKEVQQWVASWRDRHAQQTAVVPSNVTEAREWIEAWRRGRRGNGAAGRITLPSATDPETVLALVKVISAAAESAVAQRGAFCVALSGCHLQNAAFLLASVSHRDDLPNWHIFWAKEANVAHSDADSRYGAATAAFLGSRTFERRAVHAAPISPTVEICAQGYSAQLQALPPSLLPRHPSGAGLPIFDLILCNDRAGLGTGGFPDGDGESWVVPDPKEPGTVAFSRPVLEGAKSVCIHSSRS